MEEFDGLQYLDDLDDGIDKALARFRGQLSQAESDLFERLETLIGKLDIKSNSIVRSAGNLRTINELRRDLDIAIKDSQYGKAVGEFLTSFQESSYVVNQYFTALMGTDAVSKKALYQAIVNEYIQATADGLYAGTLNARFKPGVVNILQTHVTQGAPLTKMRQALRQYVIDDSQLLTYSDVVADNALNQFSRNYTEAISADLGLKHYFYKGTRIETTREFCDKRIGRYFTEAEVLAWASLKWSGKIKTTSESNIKINLGGNRCRHRLAPVTEEIYNSRKSLHGLKTL